MQKIFFCPEHLPHPFKKENHLYACIIGNSQLVWQAVEHFRQNLKREENPANSNSYFKQVNSGVNGTY